MNTRPPPRYIVLDDTDSTITYTGPGWFQDSGSKDNIGNFGPPYLHTLHGTAVDGSVSFEFNGTAVKVVGTNIVKDAKTNPDPNLECFVDDVSIGREDPFEFPENNWALCQKDGLADGPHKLRMDVKVASKDQPFWLDQILYIPSPNVPLDNTTVLLENSDPAIQFDAQWQALGGGANMTTRTNSTALVHFVGVSVSWVAFIPTELPHSGATGSYSIDNGKPNQFLLQGLPPDPKHATVYNQFYFTTPPVDPGPHTLTVTFLGSGQTTPLCLDYLYIQNGTFASSSSGNGAQAPNPPNSGGGTRAASPIGAILGGVLGGLGFLILIAACLLFWRRRRSRRDEEKPSSILGAEHIPTPFHTHSHYRQTSDNVMAQVQSHSFGRPSMDHSSSATEATPLVLASSGQLESRAMRKQQEAFGRIEAGWGVGTTTTQTAPSSISGSTLPHTTPATTVNESIVHRQHEDSGVRLHGPIEDVPPHYTPD